jgi:biopolymer transport protein TolR
MGAHLGKGPDNARKVRTETFSQINITPMVDVMLVLLVIFMVAAPMMTAGVTVDLPDSNASPIAGQGEPLAVSITANGDIWIQKSKVPFKDFQKKLKAVTSEKKDTRIFVRGDRSVDYGKIMQVVGEINEAGYNKVALVTETANASGDKEK